MQEKKSSEYINIVCLYASTSENIFSDTGLVLCELREFVPPLVEHDHYVIDSILVRISDVYSPNRGKTFIAPTPENRCMLTHGGNEHT